MAAQRTEKEENDFKKAPETPLSIPPASTIAGSPAPPPPTTRAPSSSTPPPPLKGHRDPDPPSGPNGSLSLSTSTPPPTSLFPRTMREVNRCSGCRRKVGLTGFRCRCGELFCGDHRSSDRHNCGYDYKASGRESNARENPIIKAAKIVRI